MADRQIVARTLGRSKAGALAVGQGLALAIPIGLAGGVAGTAFHIAVEQVTGLRGAHGWLLWLLPAAGLGIVALYQALGCQGLGTDDVLRTVQEGKPLPLALAPAIFLGAVLTHLCGGSAGREGAALQIGGSIGWAIGGWEKQSPAGQRCAAVCGMAALFSALFGTPLAAALFAATVAQVGDSFAPALAPSLAAAVIASGVSSAAGIPPTAFAVEMPALTGWTALQAAGLGVACAAVTRGFCWVLHQSKHLLARYLPGPYLRAAAGGLAVAVLSWLLGGRYCGAGMDVIGQAVEQGRALPWDFVCKALLTALTLGAGFKGGEVVPSFFVGACFGCVAGPLLGLPAGAAAAIGLVSVFCGATNTPAASILLAVELFGGQGAALCAIGCVLCFWLSGSHGLYEAQQFARPKLGA